MVILLSLRIVAVNLVDHLYLTILIHLVATIQRIKRYKKFSSNNDNQKINNYFFKRKITYQPRLFMCIFQIRDEDYELNGLNVYWKKIDH
ncbi:hypothetical protein BGI40_07375 [Snodgrassella communis]|nr:hypothetical protein BGI29_02875 [Snodgrassella communis]PIT29955.1 hypothetical protein BGI38_02345 [Snodgrassella communis]PIT33485.1 hypothetical protein BGI40_07375 [Snodgrassella communis]